MATALARRLYARGPLIIRSSHNLSNVLRSRIPKVDLGCPRRPEHYRLLEKCFPSYSCIVSSNYSQGPCKIPDAKEDAEKKLSLFKRFKQMYRDYWYVLLPVHVVTSAGWYGAFYYAAKSGIDIVSIMESWNVSEVFINPIRDSSMGYLAIAYALYKIATPFRYMVTLGGTTVSIKYLKEWGYIKPVPSTQQLKVMYTERKENIMESMRDQKDNLKLRTGQFKKRHSRIIGGLEKSIKTKIADTKEQLQEKKDNVLGELQKPLKVKGKDH